MEYEINGKKISYQPSGAGKYGTDEILLKQAVDLTARTSWYESGFSVQPLFPQILFSDFIKKVSKLLEDLWSKAGLSFPKNFELSRYHTLIHDQKSHLKAVEQTKLIGAEHFPVSIQFLEERISEICGQSLEVRNPWDGQRVFHFRVIRPQSGDNNPLHRDVWLEDYDNCINLYIPIAGSNEFSSLILIPGSHQWPESRVERTVSGAAINGSKFNVPAVTGINGDYHLVRPNPRENEVLVFSPYLIHGGSVNLNQDMTRISVEVRLWRK